MRPDQFNFMLLGPDRLTFLASTIKKNDNYVISIAHTQGNRAALKAGSVGCLD